MKLHRFVALLSAITFLGLSAPSNKAQSSVGPSVSSNAETTIPTTIDNPQPNFAYSRPTEKMKLRAYVFDAYGPYPILGAAFIAGRNQADKTPPEWGEGAEAYGQRFGSNLAIAAVTTTTRYAFAKAFREDTVYYRCECKGLIPRMRHALISTVTSRRGEDGHRVFSVSCDRRALCRDDDGRLPMVPGALRSQRRVADGQLYAARVRGRKPSAGIHLRGTV